MSPKLHTASSLPSICRSLSSLLVLLLAACAKPYVYPSPQTAAVPRLTQLHAVMGDGFRLPLRRWEAGGTPRAVVLAVHGLNDYSRAFEQLAGHLASRDVSVIAYDQRGFGAADGHGLWHGTHRLTADLITLSRLIRRSYPDIPLYVLGESMGGAVVIRALRKDMPQVDGVILVAPAVWSRDTMPLYQRAALWLAAHTVPAKRLTGEGLDLKPSDNIEMLRALGRDALVIKATRVDVLYGVTNLMDSAMLASGSVSGNVLLLYGAHDEIIPRQPTCILVEQLSRSTSVRLTPVFYDQGYHMLTRDLQAPVVWQDIAEWILQADQNDAASGSADLCTR